MITKRAGPTPRPRKTNHHQPETIAATSAGHDLPATLRAMPARPGTRLPLSDEGAMAASRARLARTVQPGEARQRAAVSHAAELVGSLALARAGRRTELRRDDEQEIGAVAREETGV